MKKKIPLGLRKVLDKESEGINEFFKVEYGNNSLIKFIDTDELSDYFFEVVRYKTINGIIYYELKYLPCNQETLTVKETSTVLTSVGAYFLAWKKLLIENNKESPIFDDEFEKSYFEEISPQFEIIDKDANRKPFSIRQQKIIILFLNSAEKTIKEYNKNSTQSKETIDLIHKTKRLISQETKSKVIDRVKKIIAKGYKLGLEVGEKLLIDFTVEFAKKLLLE